LPRQLGLTLALLTVILSMLSLHMWSVKAQDSLQLQVSMDKEAYDPDELIRISGRVSLSDGSPVENALVSIQVIGPTGETYHVALLYSDGAGEFLDEYRVQQGSPNGSYTVYVKASKVGFRDAQRQLQYLVTPELPSPTLMASMALILAISAVYTLRRKVQG